jgi:hypothetical protein
MEKRFVFFIPEELMDKDIDMATSTLEGSKWFLVVDLYKAFVDRRRFENNYSTTGTLKVTRGEGDSFTVDFTDFAFSDGTKVSMHYEGSMDKKSDYNDFLQYTAVLATYDLQAGPDTIDEQLTGYIQTKTYEESGAMVTNIWGYIDAPYAFYDIYLMDPDGGIFTNATYIGTDYSYSNLEFDGAFETDNIMDFFMEENSGTITLAKTATTIVLTFDNVMLSDEETVINGTITHDVAAPLPSSAPAKYMPGRFRKFNR